jgi:hypothetical protein
MALTLPDSRVNKSQLKPLLLSALDEEIEVALAAARRAQETASHEGNKPENKYDTFSLEAAYLAHGQSERILALQHERMQLVKWQVPEFDEHSVITTGALIALQAHAIPAQPPQQRWIWIAPMGGKRLQLDGCSVLVISARAPLSALLRTLGVGEELLLDGLIWEIMALY